MSVLKLFCDILVRQAGDLFKRHLQQQTVRQESREATKNPSNCTNETNRQREQRVIYESQAQEILRHQR
jgi:hypothetical protein